MTKRDRPLMVLSPRAHGLTQIRQYEPLGGKALMSILRDIAAGVARHSNGEYSQHAIFDGFTFGTPAIDALTIEQLRRVPAALVDCAIWSIDDAAAAVAKEALGYFAEEPGKFIVLACSHGCDVPIAASFRAINDDGLFASLWIDLCSESFSRIGNVLARLSGE